MIIKFDTVKRSVSVDGPLICSVEEYEFVGIAHDLIMDELVRDLEWSVGQVDIEIIVKEGILESGRELKKIPSNK